MPNVSVSAAPFRRRAAALAVAAVAASLSLAACGGDDSTTTTSSSTEATGASGASGATGASGSTAGSESVDQLETALRENLTGAQGLSAAQADCAINKIFDEISSEELQQAAETGDVPKGLFDTAFDAGVKCAGQ